MSDQAFAEAARPARRVILRLLMLEYSLGHELLLTRDQNPLLRPPAEFAELEGNAQRAAIMKAALICSSTWEENQRDARWVRLWGLSIRRSNYSAAVAEFHGYRFDGSSFPKVLPPEDSKGRELGAPYLARLTEYACGLMGPAGFDLPMGLLQWLYFTRAESDGAIRIENALERQIREEEAEIREQYRKEQEQLKQEAACPA